ncbi:MAG: DUF3084 domain-containing protein [Candidatus Eremiobacteraeota bacterium]|nr:DUF3084 domain-containing protein [Candidatus Eremiobacteraeota bacterium]
MTASMLLIDLRGVLTVVLIVIVAGAIAYIGDRVGHLVGRRRMTLFGLRPRYTSTIFAVGFGMIIALLVVAVVSLVSQEARQALFSMNRLNQQIANLTQERDQLLQDPVVLRSGEALTPPFLVRSTDSAAAIESRLSLLFQGVANLSKNFPVRPYTTNVKSPDARTKIQAAAKFVRSLDPVSAIVIPVAGENIFRGGAWRFTFAMYKNVLLYRKGEIIASVQVANGKDVSADQAALIALSTAISRSAVDHGMPPMLADNPVTSPRVFNSAVNQLTATSGAAIVKAVADADIYAEGPLSASLTVSPK